MPYSLISDLPQAIRDALPAEAQKIFLNAFNGAYGPDCGDECAFAIAWAAVKKSFEKTGSGWTKMENAAMHETTLQRLGVYLNNGGKQLFYTPEAFIPESWNGVPLVFVNARPGDVLKHPSHNEVSSGNLPPGYSFVGCVRNAKKPEIGEPTLKASLDIVDPGVADKATRGEISLSTGFGADIIPADGNRMKIYGNVQPNHVLLFPRGICPNCFPNDNGAIIHNCMENPEMADEPETVGLLKKILAVFENSADPRKDSTKDEVKEQMETIANAAMAAELEKIKAENAELKKAQETIAAENAQRESDAKWATMKNTIPPGWLGDKEPDTRKEFESDPGAFAIKVVAHNASAPGGKDAEGNSASGSAGQMDRATLENAAKAEISEFEEKYGLTFED